MDGKDLERIEGNAYRVLGLTAGATQGQIDQAARLARLMSGPDAPPSQGAGGSGWLGPVQRSPQAVERAAMLLAQPETRLSERAWWFCRERADETVPSSWEIEDQHDAALAQCWHLMRETARLPLDSWRMLLEQFKALEDSPDYARWMEAVESAGDYEKPATGAEIADALKDLSAGAHKIIGHIAQRKLADDNFVWTGAVIAMLRSRGRVSESADLLQKRLEDVLFGKCAEGEERINTAWKMRKAMPLRSACDWAVAEYDSAIGEITSALLRNMREDSGEPERTRMRVVQYLEHAAAGYEACSDFQPCLRTLERAQLVALGTIGQQRLVKRVAEVKAAALLFRPAASRGKRPRAGVGAIAIAAIIVGILSAMFSQSPPPRESKISPTLEPQFLPSPALISDEDLQRILDNINKGSVVGSTTSPASGRSVPAVSGQE